MAVDVLRASLAEQLERLRDGVPAPEAMLDVIRLERDGMTVLRPRAFDAVREAEALRGPGRLTPYWVILWKSAIALAARVQTLDLADRTVVELGCGLGLPSVAAARAGARVTAVDLAPEAVAFAAHNLAVNGVAGDVSVADWRDVEGTYDLLLASDVLYRADHVRPLFETIERLTREAWIADPGRGACREFLAVARARWSVVTEELADDVRLHHLVRRPRRRAA